MSSYFWWDEGLWWWWSSRSRYWTPAGREPNDGGRYPVVILTEDSWDYVLGRATPLKKNTPESSSTDPVITIKDMEEWQRHWDDTVPYGKLLVYEFFEKNSPLCKAMDKPFEELAIQHKGKAEFCKLDVDNFQFLARLCGVEGAYPTFVILKNGRVKGKVVGLKEDELGRTIQRALTQ